MSICNQSAHVCVCSCVWGRLWYTQSEKKSFGSHRLHAPLVLTIVLQALLLSHRQTVYSTHAHTRTNTACICRCTHLCTYTSTSTATATVPELSHMMYHSDSPYHTVITIIFIVFLTVRLSVYPIKLKLSSPYTLLLSFRLIYLFDHAWCAHDIVLLITRKWANIL